MFKKILAGITTFLLLSMPTSAFAQGKTYRAPMESLLPQDLDVVLSTKITQSDLSSMVFEEVFYGTEDEIFQVWWDTVQNDNVMFGITFDTEMEEPEDIIIAFPSNKGEFRDLVSAYEANDIEAYQSGLPYYCDIYDECLTFIGGNTYITTSEELVIEIITRYYNQTLDGLSYNTTYTEVSKQSLLGNNFEVYVKLDTFTELLLEEFAADPILNELNFGSLVTNGLASLEGAGYSVKMSPYSLKLREFGVYNENAIKELPFEFRDFAFSPGLYKKIDPSELLLMIEVSNLSKISGTFREIYEEMLSFGAFDVGVDEFDSTLDNVDLVFRLFSLMKNRFVFSLNGVDNGIFPEVTMLAEVNSQDRRVASDVIATLISLIEEPLEELDNVVMSKNKSMYSFEVSYDDPGVSSYEFDPETFEYIEVENIPQLTTTIHFGVTDGGELLLSTKANVLNDLKKVHTHYSKYAGSANMTGSFMVVDFNHISDYINHLVSQYDEDGYTAEDPSFQSFMEYLSYFDVLTSKSFVTKNTIKKDTNLLLHVGGKTIEQLLSELLLTL